MKFKDISGERFGMLTAVKRATPVGQPVKWLCMCDCGKESVVSAHHLKGNTKSCGCLLLAKADDLKGIRFGRLTAVNRAKNSAANKATWVCNCDCGNFVIVQATSLKTGNTKSCGCFRSDTSRELAGPLNRTHGMTRSKTHNTWTSMLQRCYYEGHKSYSDYGGRGITICERWMSFENFFADMGERPAGKVIGRIDNNGNYEPGNCRWEDWFQQGNNKRTNRRIEANGKIFTLAEWARLAGVNDNTIADRIERGWSIDDAVTLPAKYNWKN